MDILVIPERTEIVDEEIIQNLFSIHGSMFDITKEDVVNMLRRSRALVKGHFRLLSEKHSLIFLRFGEIARSNTNSQIIGIEIAERFKNYEVNVLITPVTAGNYVGSKVADRLKVKCLRVAVDEKGHPKPILAEGYSFDTVQAPKALIVNDLTTTGTGLREMAKIVTQQGGEVVGVGLFASRYGTNIQTLASDLRLKTEDIQFLIELDKEAFRTYDEGDCPYPGCPNAPMIDSYELNR